MIARFGRQGHLSCPTARRPPGAKVLRGVSFDVVRPRRTRWKDSSDVMRLMHPLLVLIANATESELAKCVEYLKIENQILRERLPK